MKYYIKFLIFYFSLYVSAQNNFSNDSIKYINVNLLNTDYKDFVSVRDNVYAISQNNALIEINIKNESFKLIKSNISALAKKSNEELVFGSKNGEIYILNNKEIKQIEKIDAEIFSILINSKDEYIIYSNKSIYFNKRNYVPKRKTNFYGKVLEKYTGTTLIEPDYLYLDKMNFIWFAFDEGEWEGNVCFFDLNKKKFIYDNWLLLDDEVKYKDKKDYFKKLKKKYRKIIKVSENDTIYKYPYNLSITSATKGVAYNQDNELFLNSSGGGHTIIHTSLEDTHYHVDGTISKIYIIDKDYYKNCFKEEFLVDKEIKNAFFEKDFRHYRNKDSLMKNKKRKENEINILGTITFNEYDNTLYFYNSKRFKVTSKNSII